MRIEPEVGLIVHSVPLHFLFGLVADVVVSDLGHLVHGASGDGLHLSRRRQPRRQRRIRRVGGGKVGHDLTFGLFVDTNAVIDAAAAVVVVALSALEDEVEHEECEEEAGEVAEGEEDDEALGHAVERHDHHPSRRRRGAEKLTPL